MHPHIFVYGTLLSGAGHPMGARLRLQARLVGEATITGCRLYSLGRYPGLVEAGEQELVHGELYALNSPADSLTWLDAYEGIVPANRGQNQYERVERTVRLASGQEIAAWVYLYRKGVAGLQLIADGRWLPYSR